MSRRGATSTLPAGATATTTAGATAKAEGRGGSPSHGACEKEEIHATPSGETTRGGSITTYCSDGKATPTISRANSDIDMASAGRSVSGTPEVRPAVGVTVPKMKSSGPGPAGPSQSKPAVSAAAAFAVSQSPVHNPNSGRSGAGRNPLNLTPNRGVAPAWTQNK